MPLTACFARRLIVLSLAFNTFLCAQDEHPRLALPQPISDKSIIDEIHFYGDAGLAIEEQSRLEAMYKAECGCDDAVKELTERVRYLYQEHGYYKAQAQSTPHLLDVDGGKRRVSVDVHIEQNLQYRLRRLDLTGQKAFSAEQLRTLFPIQQGEVFNVEKIREGLDNL